VTSLDRLVDDRTTIVCCGPGGVGKTTMAAAIALEAAGRGRRTCVVTIDPAKRLADALGIESLTNSPKPIQGPWPGELWALMLDTKTTFDDLVVRNAGSPEQAAGILDNRLYRNISGALSGTQEYMAMEKLYELHCDEAFDLVVVDTPPTRNALSFLDAPRRLVRFLDNRVFRVLMMPTRAYLRAVSLATQAFLRTISKVVGSEVVHDAVAFFAAFEGMEDGFRHRASRMMELLHDPSTAFVLVASPRRDAVEESTYFADELAAAALPVDALVVNRLHPRFGPLPAEGSLSAIPATPAAEGPLGVLVANLADLDGIARREESHFAALAAKVAPAPVVRVPFLPADVHDLEGLTEVGAHLFEH
jgi:anion-transporting  ArsA/GET3 family ATPase